MNAAAVACALGAAHRSGHWWSCRCPAHDDRAPSLSLRDGEYGLLVKCWAGCDPRDVLAALRRLGLTAGAVYSGGSALLTRLGGKPEPAARRIRVARRIWDAAREPLGTPVEAYLRGRGITFAPPPSLRWVPSLRRPDGSQGPAMVARIDSNDDELIGLHRTWLERDTTGVWRRRNRAMLGHAAGSAVRLAPVAETLMVGEGIETCLAAMQAAAMPAWAALSTSGLIALALPPIVAVVMILADHDRSGAGERAARAAAQRWLAEGRRVRIALPSEPGSDFNDVLNMTETRHAAA